LFVATEGGWVKKFLNAQEVMILNVCRDIELTGEELYFHFAEIFKDDTEAAVQAVGA
jgi:hypothetical protein